MPLNIIIDEHRDGYNHLSFLWVVRIAFFDTGKDQIFAPVAWLNVEYSWQSTDLSFISIYEYTEHLVIQKPVSVAFTWANALGLSIL